MTIAAMNPSAGQRDNSMALDHLQNSGLTRALTDLLGDLAELVQKELQLAKTEISEKITSRLRASAWMVAAAVLGMIAALLRLGATLVMPAGSDRPHRDSSRRLLSRTLPGG